MSCLQSSTASGTNNFFFFGNLDKQNLLQVILQDIVHTDALISKSSNIL